MLEYDLAPYILLAAATMVEVWISLLLVNKSLLQKSEKR